MPIARASSLVDAGAKSLRGVFSLVWLTLVLSPAWAASLNINANTSDPAPREAWQALIGAFSKENPDIRVRYNIFDHESYKASIRNWLTGASPDIVFWFAGQRMNEFVGRGLLEDISDLYTSPVKAEFPSQAIELVSAGGRQFGVPYSHYHVGIFFRRDLLERAGLSAPETWEDLVRACKTLRAGGLDPFAIGSKNLWPTAAWFDYINLRMNGYVFHRRLMDGIVPYTDARVRAVFARWRELIDADCFPKNHTAMSWQESQALIYQGRSAMMLIGNYIVPNFPDVLKGQMEFIAFPVIDRGVESAEEAPMNSIHMPSRAANKDAARRFLAYVLRADVQASLNKRLMLLPVNSKADVADDRFLARGRELMAKAAALTQFFDRDTSEDLALIAMKGFQEFMDFPDRLESVLSTIEQARRRIYRQ